MPVDRFGQRVDIAYAAHEILWIEAANTLDPHERACCFGQIASLTGRSIANIRDKANSLRKEAIQKAYEANREAPTRRVMVSASPTTHPSTITGPTKARLMAGK